MCEQLTCELNYLLGVGEEQLSALEKLLMMLMMMMMIHAGRLALAASIVTITTTKWTWRLHIIHFVKRYCISGGKEGIRLRYYYLWPCFHPFPCWPSLTLHILCSTPLSHKVQDAMENEMWKLVFNFMTSVYALKPTNKWIWVKYFFFIFKFCTLLCNIMRCFRPLHIHIFTAICM